VTDGGGIVEKDVGIQNEILHAESYDSPPAGKSPFFQTLEKMFR